MTRRLFQNALFLPEVSVYLVSTHRHDYVSYTLPDGLVVSTDGGCEYLHRSYHMGADAHRVVDWCLYEDDPFEVYRDKLLWGTRGPDGKEALHWIPLRYCGLDHLRAIRDTQPQIKGTVFERVVDWWIETKEETG